MAAHRSHGGLLARFRESRAFRRARVAAARERQDELRDEIAYQSRLAWWKDERRTLARKNEPLGLAGPEPRRSPSGYDQET